MEKITNTQFTLPFSQISAKDLILVGGKGANLGEMTQGGLPVPDGFCLTTSAFKAFMADFAGAHDMYAQLTSIQTDDLDMVRQVGQTVRQNLANIPIPHDVKTSILSAWHDMGTEHAYAVRSSATAEDLPSASFAGQQDTYLNIKGEASLLEHVRKCWISLFTDRAILYRAKNNFPHRDVHLSVVVQRMIFPDISGIMFTADPVTGHRKIVSIDASYGLGEALVSGIVSADLYKVDKRNQAIVEIKVADKKLAIRPKPDGGTYQEKLGDDLCHAQVLNDEQIRALVKFGTRIEAHYGCPQDIEWCMEGTDIYMVQTRPITSLFPLPKPPPSDGSLHVYLSFNHIQVMTDPISPMGISILQLLIPFGKEKFPMHYNPYFVPVGGRAYIDLSAILQLPIFNRLYPEVVAAIVDPLMGQPIRDVIDREEFRCGRHNPEIRASVGRVAKWLLPIFVKTMARTWIQKPDGIVNRVEQYLDQKLESIHQHMSKPQTLAERLKVPQYFLGEMLLDILFKFLPAIISGILSQNIIRRMFSNYITPIEVISLAQGLSGNATTEMDLSVGDLADTARQSPKLVKYLLNTDARTILENMESLPDGQTFAQAWHAFLEKYGMRGPSEIDIARPCWRDNAESLLQVVLGNLQHGESGTHRKHHQRLVVEREKMGARLVENVQHGMFGKIKSKIAQRLVRNISNYMVIREHPKFFIIHLLDLTKKVIIEAAEVLHAQDRLDNVSDVWYLEFLELIFVVEHPHKEIRSVIAKRKTDYIRYHNMIPPRIMTSDGEIPMVKHSRENIPEGALAGSPVSQGIVEGIAKVITDPQTEIINHGEILVAPFTDPGWTPLFINAVGLVMEVGGLMTHGSVVAREYGIPAVVGVLNCTKLIKTGQRIRVHGDLGYVEILGQ